MAEIELTGADSGRGISAASGDSIRIALTERPTTGFRWALGPLDPKCLALEGSEFRPEASGALGGRGVRTFRLKALGKGSAGVELRLARSWESAEPQSTFRIRIEIG